MQKHTKGGGSKLLNRLYTMNPSKLCARSEVCVCTRRSAFQERGGKRSQQHTAPHSTVQLHGEDVVAAAGAGMASTLVYSPEITPVLPAILEMVRSSSQLGWNLLYLPQHQTFHQFLLTNSDWHSSVPTLQSTRKQHSCWLLKEGCGWRVFSKVVERKAF